MALVREECDVLKIVEGDNLYNCRLGGLRMNQPEDAEWAIIFDRPEIEELQNGRSFSGYSSRMLKGVLDEFHLPHHVASIHYLWQHSGHKEKGAEHHASASFDQLMADIGSPKRNIHSILIMGNDVSKLLTGVGAEELSGLNVKNHFNIPLTAINITVCSPMLSSMGEFSDAPAGEIALAIEKFAKRFHNA